MAPVTRFRPQLKSISSPVERECQHPHIYQNWSHFSMKDFDNDDIVPLKIVFEAKNKSFWKPQCPLKRVRECPNVVEPFKIRTASSPT